MARCPDQCQPTCWKPTEDTEHARQQADSRRTGAGVGNVWRCCIELYGGYRCRFDVAAFAVDCVKVLRTVSELFAGEFDGFFSALSLAPFSPYF